MSGSTRPVGGWLASGLAALVLFTLPLPEWAVENLYSRGFFRRWQPIVTSVSNLAPFALLDLLILAVVAVTLWRAVRLVRSISCEGVLAVMWEGLRRLIRASAVLTLVFLVMWGLNYRRTPLDRTTPPVTPSVEELRAVVAGAGAIGARLRPAAEASILGFDEIRRTLPAPMNAALAALGRPALGAVGRPKYSLLLTPFFTSAGVDGMIDPFALETIVHPDLLPFERPFALGHEWAHLSGTADEAEASAIGWLACMHGPPALAYSASVYLIVEGAAALPRSVWRDLARQLDPGIRADLQAMAERQARQRPRVQRTAFRVYDQYLRANSVDDGVASYSRALTLILSPRVREALSGYRADRDRRP